MKTKKLIIHIETGIETQLLEDLLFDVKSGEIQIETISWVKDSFCEPAKMTITYKKIGLDEK